MLIAINNAQAILRGGFTAARDMGSHDNGYGDVDIRDAINLGEIDGPRFQVAGRGIDGGRNRGRRPTPLDAIAVRSVDDARAAIREHVERKVDWIKLYPTGGYSFTATGEAQYVLTYPLPVLQALVDEAHRLGRKTACHSFGGEGLQNTIAAGCDAVEHGYGLTQEQLNTMVRRGSTYDPTFVRYTEPYMDDNDAKNTGGKFRMIPIFERAVRMGGATRAQGDGRQRRRRQHLVHGAQALEFEWLAKRAGMASVRAIQAGTIVNAEVMGWQTRHRLHHQGQVRRPGGGVGRSRRRHHRAAAGEVRDEGRKGDQERPRSGGGERHQVARQATAVHASHPILTLRQEKYPSGPTTATPAAGHRYRNRRARHVARTCERRNTRPGLIGRIPLQQGRAQGVREPKNKGQGGSGNEYSGRQAGRRCGHSCTDS